MSGLLIEISELAGRPGAVKEISKSQALEGLSGVLGRVQDDRVDLALIAESVIEGIQVSGKISGNLELSCSRCLVPYSAKFEHPVDETFFFTGGEERGGYEVVEDKIDLEPMVRDVVVLGIPTRPLHRADCKGLCPRCGTDLNERDCGHRRELVDLRWAPLKSLKLEEPIDADSET